LPIRSRMLACSQRVRPDRSLGAILARMRPSAALASPDRPPGSGFV
jgi:hypothetical protein